MLNVIWILMVLGAVICGGWTGRLDEVARASIDGAETAVKLAIGLVGIMAFWLGMMRVLQEAGFLRVLARWLKPVMVKLFPEVPADHPAMSMMILNTSANILGLANAATPFGLKAMTELNRLNPRKGVATNAMALFLAINTAGITILPTTMIALRASLGASSPGSIFLPTFFASIFGTLAAVISALALQRLPIFRLEPSTGEAMISDSFPATPESSSDEALVTPPSFWQRVLGYGAVVLISGFVLYALFQKVDAVGWKGALRILFSDWILLLLIAAVTITGLIKGVKVYEAVVEGGKEAFGIALKIIPFLVAMLAAVGMLRASGAVESLSRLLGPLIAWIGMPPEVFPMAVLRSFTSSGAMGIATDIMKAHGPDSLIGVMASTIQQTSETTLYVLAVYFGAIQVKRGRHTLLACLLADAAAVIASVWFCRWIFG